MVYSPCELLPDLQQEQSLRISGTTPRGFGFGFESERLFYFWFRHKQNRVKGEREWGERVLVKSRRTFSMYVCVYAIFVRDV